MGLTRASALFLFLIPAAGCAIVSSSFTPTNTPPRPMQARPVSSVVLYTSAVPDRPFVEVGFLSSGRNAFARDEDTILALRTKAAEVGCDGVFLQNETTNYVVGSSTTTDLKRYRAACIMFKDTGTKLSSASVSGE